MTSALLSGHGRVAARRYCCWCPACCLAHESGEGMNALLDVADCERRHLTRFADSTITCTQTKGLGNAKARAKALWPDLKRNVKAGKFAAVQARELWSTEEKVHLRPGHFWACELGDADGKGSPILEGPFAKRTTFEGQRYDPGECAILLRRYYHRVADDRQGLTFMRWQAEKGERLIINSSELRAVQGHQANDFVLRPLNPPQLRQKLERTKKLQKKGKVAAEVHYSPKQRWMLELDIDSSTRKVCEAT